MKVEEIHKEWANDCKLQLEKLDQQSLDIPILHSKYLKIISQERILLRMLRNKRNVLGEQLQEYFLGRLDGKEIDRKPFPITETKSGALKRTENDDEYLNLSKKIEIQEEKMIILEEIMKNINQRNFQIKNAIEYLKWTHAQI